VVGLITNLSLPNNPTKPLLIFVGGALDHRYKPLLEGVYQPYHFYHSHHQDIHYALHSERKSILKWVKHWHDHAQSVCLIGHSWGCQSILDTAHKIELKNSIDLLITLDPVSRKFINQRAKKPHSVKRWLNVYIDGKQSRLERSNLIAILGGRWDYRENADENICLQQQLGEEVTHAKARLMFAVVEEELERVV